jgi:CRP-like cAMP-binding protein
MHTAHDLEPLLAQHPFFAGLAPEHVEFIAGCATNARFNAGEPIFREGSPADRFYLLRFGRAAVDLFVPGRGPITIQTVGEGELLGWSWMLPPYRCHHDARALEQVRALAFDGACLRKKCEGDPRLGYELMRRFARVIVERLQATQLQLVDVYGDRAVPA